MRERERDYMGEIYKAKEMIFPAKRKDGKIVKIMMLFMFFLDE